MALAPGTRVGSYEVIVQIGAGGMGEVYRARDTKLGRDVAIKLLPASFAGDPDRLARFEREARVLASLNHPNIATLYGLEDTGGVVALVMELVDGETLAARIAAPSGVSHQPSPSHSIPEALAIARQLADALDAAHERGIIHRDLKPANIVVASTGTVKVLDFGLAKIDASGGSDGSTGDVLTHSPTVIAPTIAGVLLGTAPYMSPEQARGRAVDKRTDIWAFGCVMYEMLAGRRAFGGETTADALAAIVAREPDWSALPPATPAHVVELVGRCLEKDPRRRLRDIGDARLDLDKTSSRADESQASKPTGRERLAWLTAGIAPIVAAAAVGLAIRSPGSSSSTPPVISRVVRLTSGPALENGPAVSPDGKWVAYLSNERGVTDVWVKFIAGGQPANLTASANPSPSSQSDLGGIAISPDGTQIAFDAAPPGGGPPLTSTWVMPAPLGGVPRKLLERGRGMRWSPDGTKILYMVAGGSGGDAVWVADADGSNAREVAPRRGGMHKHWSAWSHDGRYVYFNYSTSTANLEQTEIYRVPAAGGPIEPFVTTTKRAAFPAPMPNGLGLIYSANPDGADLLLWWRPLDLNGEPRRLTTGLGEYAEPYLAADGRSLVATVTDLRRTVIRVPVAGSRVSYDQTAEITSGFTGDLDPVLSPQGDRLVFGSTRSGSRNLWAARPDGTEPRPLTAGTAFDERPSFSPDGQRIAFVSDRGGRRGVWVMNADGGAARMLFAAQALDTISWSPDGQRIVYSVPGEQPELWLATVADGSTRRLPTPGPASAPAWSPHGDVIAYIDNVPGGPTRPISARIAYVTAAGQVVHPDAPLIQTIGNGALAWSPDGRRIAAIGNSGAVASVIFIVDAEQREQPRQLLEFPPDVRLRGVAWSKDGQSLIVGQQRRASDIVLFGFTSPGK